MALRPAVGWLLALAIALIGASSAHPQKDKDKDKKPPALAEAKGVTRLEYSPDGSFILMDYRANLPSRPDQTDAILGIWDAKTGEFKLKLDKPPRTCERIAISPDNKKVAAVNVGSKQLKVWDATNGKVLEEQALPDWKGSISFAPFLKFTPDGSTLYSVWNKQILEMKLGAKPKLLGAKLDSWSPEEMAFDAAGKRFLVAYNILGKPAGELRTYDLAKDGAMEKVPTTGHVRAMALSGDGKTLALSYLPNENKSRLEFWDAATGKLRATAPTDSRKGFRHYGALAISPDGKTLAGAPVFDKDGTKLLDILDADGKVTREVSKQNLRALTLTFSPDGKTLAVILSNYALLFLDPATGEEKKP